MKRLLLGLCVATLFCAAVALSESKAPRPEFDFKLEERNPVSHLRLNNAADTFQFAVVSDRTGGHRPRIFSQAIEQLNLLQPEFVVSVGDLIEGYTEETAKLTSQWREFQGYLARLQMPFFYVPGNHDLANVVEDRVWKEKFGRRYYHFTYKDVLFLMLCSEDPPGNDNGRMSAEQLGYLRKSLDDNKNVRWTLVFLHKPMWVMKDLADNGWLDAEKLLAGRNYTVFAGHVHRYQKFVRQGMNYYQLATTGGASKLRGLDYGEFDHITWITMKKDGPLLANILLDGIYPEDLKRSTTAEEGAPIYHRKPVQNVKGNVTFEGAPVPGAYVVFQTKAAAGIPSVRADAFTEADGSFTLSSYTAFDGAPTGDYQVTVVWRKPFYEADGKAGPNHLPERYAKVETTPLKASVKSGSNTFALELTK